MSKWNFNIDKSIHSSDIKENFESSSIKEKIRKIRSNKLKFENTKGVGLLESVFDPLEKLYEDMVSGNFQEGFDMNNQFTNGISNAGNEILAGMEGIEDSLQSAFNKISKLNSSNKTKINYDIVNDIKSQSSKVSDALSGAKNFIIPDPSVANIAKEKIDSAGVSENTLFQGTQSGINSLVNRTKGSSFFDQLSADSVNIGGKITALQGDINNQKLLNPNSPGVFSTSDLAAPGSAPGFSNSSIHVVGLGDQLKTKMKEAMDRISNLLNIMMKFLSKELKYGAEKVKSFFVHFRDNFNYVMITIANALTHNNSSVAEVKVFSSETLKFTTVLFTYVFLYNWYYLMFHNDDPDFRFKIDVDEQVLAKSKILYALFGPSLRVLELFDWILLEKIPMIKNYITSKPILFFGLAVVFFMLVLGNFQMSILTSFLKSLTFSTNQTKLSIFTSIIVLGYGLKFICYDAGILGAIGGTHSVILIILGGLFFILLFILYLVFISTFSAPLGVLLVNTYIVIYSFFAILIYEKSNTFTVVNNIFTAVSGLNGGEEEAGEDNSEPKGIVTRIGNFINKYIKFINMFLVELLVIMILLFGINTYTSQYGSIVFDKTSSVNKNSISAPVNSAFTHLFTWLIIFNTLLIIFILVRMVAKYYRLTDPTQQTEGEREETETG